MKESTTICCRNPWLPLVLLMVGAMGSTNAFAADNDANPACKTVRFGQPAWAGASVKTATASWMLQKLGYHTKMTKASLPIIYTALAENDMDVLLAQWMPSQRKLFRSFGIDGSIDIVGPNLTGGHYTIGVPKYVYDAGVTSIADLNKHRDQFKGRIYGIDQGSGGNTTITEMIDDDYAGLGDWKLKHSSTGVMVAEVGRHIKRKKWIAFLAWTPHPMNVNYDIKYLSGGVDYWGKDKGSITVNTVSAKGFAWKCPDVGQFLANYKWTPDEQSRAMLKVKNVGMDPLAAGQSMIEKNPDLLDRWFGNGGIYQSGPVKSANGQKNARAVIVGAMGSKDTD